MDDHVITLRVTGTGGDVARVAVRRQQFAVGRPIEFDDAAPRIAALEYALGAAGAEVVNGLRMFAERRQIEIDAIEAVVAANLEHALAYLEVVGEPGRPAIRRVHIKVFASCTDQQGAREVFDTMRGKLPLAAMLDAATHLTTELIFTA
ncbi:MAG: hypothetical protein ACJ731_09315 [Vicinamibacterales bacterium]